jgi:hypothetical protein
MVMGKKERKRAESGSAPSGGPAADNQHRDEIDFPTVIWSLAILAVLVLLHRLIWGS